MSKKTKTILIILIVVILIWGSIYFFLESKKHMGLSYDFADTSYEDIIGEEYTKHDFKDLGLSFEIGNDWEVEGDEYGIFLKNKDFSLNPANGCAIEIALYKNNDPNSILTTITKQKIENLKNNINEEWEDSELLKIGDCYGELTRETIDSLNLENYFITLLLENKTNDYYDISTIFFNNNCEESFQHFINTLKVK